MIKIPLYPEYSKSIELLKIIEGINVQDFKNMWNAIWELRGTPQNNVDWKEPDNWIPERLKDKDKEIAQKIWFESNKTINPRWTRGDQFLISGYKLIEEVEGFYKLTEKGKIFISNIENEVIKQLDLEEGLIQILIQLSLIRKGKRIDLLEEWKEYTQNNSNLKQDSVIKDYLRRRLVNLIDRNYIKRDGNIYFITEKGINYLKKVNKNNLKPILNKEIELNREVEEFTLKQKHTLKEYLRATTPYQFEYIIRDLLMSMGYDEVEVTSPTNDKGVDVTGVSQNGITTVKEVIQVKRNITTNVARPILDSLRGSLHRFDAFQGTIITLSDFTKGAKEAAFEKGVAPLTLINGDKLIDLLLQYEIGIKKKVFKYFTVDKAYFDNEGDNID